MPDIFPFMRKKLLGKMKICKCMYESVVVVVPISRSRSERLPKGGEGILVFPTLVPMTFNLYIRRWRSRISAEAKNMADQATYSHEVLFMASELNITGRLPEAGNLKPNITAITFSDIPKDITRLSMRFSKTFYSFCSSMARLSRNFMDLSLRSRNCGKNSFPKVAKGKYSNIRCTKTLLK